MSMIQLHSVCSQTFGHNKLLLFKKSLFEFPLLKLYRSIYGQKRLMNKVNLHYHLY